MDRGSESFKVGLTFLVTLTILIGGYVWLSNFRLGRHRYLYRAFFPTVSWLNKGDLVMVSGVPKGRVRDIRLFPDSVVVTFWIEDFPLREGARVWIESQGIVGEKRLGVYLGRGDPLPEGTLLEGEVRPDLNAILQIAYNLGGHIEALAEDLRALLVELQARLDRTEGTLTQTLSDLRRLTREVRALTRAGGRQVDSTLAGIRRLTLRVDSLMAWIEAGQGTLGKVIQDTTLYGEINRTLKEVQELLTDIRKNPERYIRLHFSLF